MLHDPNNSKGLESRQSTPLAAVVCRRSAHWATCLLTLLLAGASVAQEVVDERLEYNVKAASIYAFGRYVTWPDSAFENEKSPFVIGVLGGNPFGDALDHIAEKKTIQERRIEVRLLESPEQCAGCHIVFVTRAVPKASEAEVFKYSLRKPVLLVGETNGFAERGGIINFYQSGNNVRFELNPEIAEEAKLNLNAKLLSLGTKAATRR
jgi:hypothetical protein